VEVFERTWLYSGFTVNLNQDIHPIVCALFSYHFLQKEIIVYIVMFLTNM
jgi:hypothetical protein